MASTVPDGQQISDTLADVAVDLAGVKLPVSTLTGAILVVGETGCGKTRSIVNNISRQFAEMFTHCGKAAAEKRQFAVFYFALKGRGHAEFISSIPKARRKDVIRISSGKDCPWVVRLFERDSWASADDLHLAVVNFVEGVAAQLSGPTTTGRHDPFWSRQRIRFLSELCRLQPMAAEHFDFFAEDMSALTHNDALVALLARIEAFLEFIAAKSPVPEQSVSKPLSSLRQDLKEQGFESAAELLRAEKIATAYSKLPHLNRHPKVRALALFLASVLKRARQEKRAKPKTLLDAFAETLEPSSRERLLKLVEQFWRIPEITRGCIEADLRGVVQSFHTGAAKTVFGAVGKREISIEEVIDRGLIMVVDLPVADSGNASLPALVAMKLALTQRLIGRYTARYKDRR